ncbi:MAG: hypothetical protein ACRDZ9_01330 [Acidimicrobiales bacterium]
MPPRPVALGVVERRDVPPPWRGTTAIPALAAGNSVVAKPPSDAPIPGEPPGPWSAAR